MWGGQNQYDLFKERNYTMARFPRTEAEVIALAEAMITGLTDNAVL